MKSVIKYSFIFFCFLSALNLGAVERKEVPKSVGYVNDFASMLSSDERANLEQKLVNYFDSTATQIAVITEKNLNGRDRFDRAMDFAVDYKVGTQGKDNGIILYIAAEDRLMYILTSKHTEGALTDGMAGTIIRNYITPAFKEGNYYAGIDAGIDQIILALSGEFVNDIEDKKSFPIALIIVLIIVVLAIVFSKNNNGSGGYNGRGTYWFPSGPIGGGSGWGGASSGGGSWGGFGGGGSFGGGGAGGGW